MCICTDDSQVNKETMRFSKIAASRLHIFIFDFRKGIERIKEVKLRSHGCSIKILGEPNLFPVVNDTQDLATDDGAIRIVCVHCAQQVNSQV